MGPVHINPVISFVADSLERYPQSEIRDIYKLLYQAHHGGEHAVVDRKTAWESFELEWKEVSGRASVGTYALLEPIFMEGLTPQLYRAHLRPAIEQGISPERIFEGFLRTATEFPKEYPTDGDDLAGAFIAAWMEVGGGIERGELALMEKGYIDLTSDAESAGWPSVHHTETYRRVYNPHYRLVMDPSRLG